MNILSCLAATYPAAMSVPLLQNALGLRGLHLVPAKIEAHLNFLRDRALVSFGPRTHAARGWFPQVSITVLGLEHLQYLVKKSGQRKSKTQNTRHNVGSHGTPEARTAAAMSGKNTLGMAALLAHNAGAQLLF
jgi:hypothetical protein